MDVKGDLGADERHGEEREEAQDEVEKHEHQEDLEHPHPDSLRIWLS